MRVSRHQGQIRTYNTLWIHNHRKISCSLIINKKSPSRWEITFIHSHIPITTKGVWKRKIIFKSHLLMLIIKIIFIWIPKKFKFSLNTVYLMSYAMIHSKMCTNNGRQSNVIYIIGQHSWIITNKSRQKDAMILPLWWYYYAHPENMYLGQTAILTFILSRSNPWHCLQT